MEGEEQRKRLRRGILVRKGIFKVRNNMKGIYLDIRDMKDLGKNIIKKSAEKFGGFRNKS